MKTSNIFLILAAAGSSTRMGMGIKKEYIEIGQGTVLSQSAKAFLLATENKQSISHIIITIPKDNEELAKRALFADESVYNLLKKIPYSFIPGGNSRQESVYNALRHIKALIENLSSEVQQKAIVLIHDAARPFVSEQIITDTIACTQKYGAAVPYIPAVDTQKIITEDGTIQTHLKRSSIAAVQTPQGFLFLPLLECHEQAILIKKEFTDDTEIWDAYPDITGNRKVHIVPGNIQNKKITYAKDIAQNMTHIGIGTDLHKLVEGRTFFLGGISIPAEKGELGHSDGDVLLHAITDALLGASGLGDIGSYFPPEDIKWKDADSAKLLQTVWKDIQNNGWHLINLDCVVEVERPKFLPWRQKVIDSIASILQVSSSQIFVKAKTNEKLDSVGNGDAVKAYAVCLLER
ncbi:MAG: 2-C-methyl-D-erythritol 2,4-cyclodiphosphate synthase [Treponema sp.]|nr:2-C-methyl-D-erythritol 2,4-cyclodiphosphate synthase [Treponema sp.]